MSDVMPPRLHRRADDLAPAAKNVLDLVDAAIMRTDDMAELRAKLADEKITRMEREWISLEKIANIREQHAHEMRESEAKRLDAIRATDVAAVSTTAAQSLAAIQALASTATATAETLRNQVSTTATTIANQTDRIVSPIMERLAALEKIVNIGQGRSTVADPQISELMTEMRKLSTSRDVGDGRSAGFDKSWAIALAVIAAMFMYLNYQSRTAVAPTTPQVIMVPAPSGTLLPTTPPSAAPR